MNILLNVDRRELASFSGDLSFYRHLLAQPMAGVEFRLLNGRGRAFRELRKGFERLNRRSWPEGFRQALLQASRWSYVHPSNLRGVELVVSHILFPPGAARCIPVLWSSQGIAPSFYYAATGPFTREDVAELYRRWGERAALMLIWTRSGAGSIRDLCPETPIRVLPPLTCFAPLRPEWRALPPAPASCQILFVGRDPGRKGLSDLLEAYRWARGRGAPIALDVVSRLESPGRGALGGIPGVAVYEGVSESILAELMERADVLVLPTRAETYGFVLLEGMARGCALIASACPPLDELVEEGRNGFLVPPSDGDQLAGRLERLGRDRALLDDLKENSRRKYRREFSAEVLAPRYLEMFREARERYRIYRQRGGA